MNPIVEEIQSYIEASESTDNEDLLHYGMPRRSGRYPYGSGEQPFQGSRDFLGRVDELRKSKFTFTDADGKTWTGDNAIAKSMGLTTSEFRRQISWADYEKRCYKTATAKALQKDGLGPTEIGRKMGESESTVRGWLKEDENSKMHQAIQTVDFLKEHADKKGMIDVGVDVERELGISRTRLDVALDYLEKAEGYPVYEGRIPQINNKGQHTTQKVLCKPGTEHKEIYEYDKVQTVTDYISRDGGDTYQKKFHYPESLDSKRLQIRYKEDGGIDKDGVIELRRGVDDLSLGDSKYSQVRILVDKTHYLKGMAVYSDDMPDGVDVVFNTNKTKDVPMHKVLKEIKADPDNPFGSLIKDANQGGQYWYDDPKTGKKKLGLINKRADEGDWEEWADALPSQFLGKQSKHMAKKQLDLAKADKMDEFADICALENPTIKKHLLEKFADNCDSAAVNLKAAALPGQKYHVIIPVNTLKDNEVYAPKYEDGTKLALIRYPHGGTFEIPICTVNNKHAAAKKLLGADITDAVGINARVAERLSGADFDGDTVMCIPTHDPAGKVKITSKPPLKGLEGFDPKLEYPETPGMKYMKDPVTGKDSTQRQMGEISNLITDMTLGGATQDELARAVRHSMVVIDAGKHKLNYKKSEQDNNISALKNKYQVHIDEDGNIKTGGASTLLSSAKGDYSVIRRQGSYKINTKDSPDYDPTKPEGAKLWKITDDPYYPARVSYDKDTKIATYRTNDGKKISYDVTDKDAVKKYAPVKKIDPKTGKTIFENEDGTISYRVEYKKQQSTKMAETDDAYSLVSPNQWPMEKIYADFANDMKSLGNKARLELANTGKIAYSRDAAKEYKAEVDSLMNKLNTAKLNTVRERAAQRMANAELKAKTAADPNLKGDDKRKIGQQALNKARVDVQAISRRDRNIEISDREWEAIQKGAISETNLKKILNNADIEKLRERATPRTTSAVSSAKINRIKAMASSNYTIAQIAAKLGVSPATVTKYVKGVRQ